MMSVSCGFVFLAAIALSSAMYKIPLTRFKSVRRVVAESGKSLIDLAAEYNIKPSSNNTGKDLLLHNYEDVRDISAF
jgi:hypothetical protein